MRGAPLALAIALASASAAEAHHGFGSFDLNRDIELHGVVKGIDFVNPHSWLYLDVTGPDGVVTSYRCEMRGATVLRRSGWTPEMFKPGDTITVTGAPDRRDPGSCYVGTITLANGVSVDRYGQLEEPEPATELSAERPARTAWGAPNIAGDWAGEQLVMTDPRGLVGTLVPLSAADAFAPGEVPAGATPFPGSRGADPNLRSFASARVPLTPLGQAAADDYEDLSVEKNPRMRCESTSVIFDWTFDTVVHRIAQTEDAVTISYGQYGLVRDIRLDRDAHPSDLAPSHAGDSIGRWDGDTLVVDTIGFTPGLLAPPIHHGEKLHVVERFDFDAGTGVLTRRYVAQDPDYWVGDYAGADTVRLSDTPFGPDACEDTSLTVFSGDDPETEETP